MNHDQQTYQASKADHQHSQIEEKQVTVNARHALACTRLAHPESNQAWLRSQRSQYSDLGFQVIRFASRAQRQLLDALGVILPDQCQLCHRLKPPRPRGGICQGCLRQLPRIENGCRRCGAPMPAVVGAVEDCPHCRKGDWPAEQVLAFGVYTGLLRKAVIQLKHPGSEPAAYSLGIAMSDWLRPWLITHPVDLIISTPKHWSKNWLNPYNSAELLSDALGTKLSLEVDHRTLVRSRATAKQGTLLRQSRAENVAKAFRVVRPKKVRSRRILLVDDIVTSGATAAEMTRSLQKAGAASVYVVCLARGVGK